MFLDYIEHIRKKPFEARRRFAVMWSIILTGGIVFIWISVLWGTSPVRYEQTIADTSKTATPASESFISRIKSSLTNNTSFMGADDDTISKDSEEKELKGVRGWNNAFEQMSPTQSSNIGFGTTSVATTTIISTSTESFISGATMSTSSIQ